MKLLPGKPGASLEAVWASLTDEEREALLPHLTGDSPSRWLSQVLTEAGHPIGKTSINNYRRTLGQDVQV